VEAENEINLNQALAIADKKGRMSRRKTVSAQAGASEKSRDEAMD
jgi:hypothetical protein